VIAKLEDQVDRLHYPTLKARQDKEEHAVMRYEMEGEHKQAAETYKAQLKQELDEQSQMEAEQKRGIDEFQDECREQRNAMAHRVRVRKLALAAQALESPGRIGLTCIAPR